MFYISFKKPSLSLKNISIKMHKKRIYLILSDSKKLCLPKTQLFKINNDLFSCYNNFNSLNYLLFNSFKNN